MVGRILAVVAGAVTSRGRVRVLEARVEVLESRVELVERLALASGGHQRRDGQPEADGSTDAGS